MNIFYNFKINSLVKRVIGKEYESRLDKLTLTLLGMSDNEKLELATLISLSEDASRYAKLLIGNLFNPESGLFRNDISNDNIDFRFGQLYEVMVAWFMWTYIPNNLDGSKNQKIINLRVQALETCLGISQSFVLNFYNLLLENETLSKICFYRWCTLAIGHNDKNYESMHENSPDCQKFIQNYQLVKNEISKERYGDGYGN